MVLPDNLGQPWFLSLPSSCACPPPPLPRVQKVASLLDSLVVLWNMYTCTHTIMTLLIRMRCSTTVLGHYAVKKSAANIHYRFLIVSNHPHLPFLFSISISNTEAIGVDTDARTTIMACVCCFSRPSRPYGIARAEPGTECCSAEPLASSIR